MQTLGDIGELEIIRRITRGLVEEKDTLIGPGDDCAVVRPSPDLNEDWVFTSDPVIEKRHFAPDAEPGSIGHKAIARALSDIAAMGAAPAWALINIVAHESMPCEDLETLYAGLRHTAARYNVALIGGDVAQGEALHLHVFAVGRCPRGSAVLRQGAHPGDGLYVTGELGGSSLKKHLHFEPRITEGIFLRDWARAMMDISDGLATDSHHLADRSNVGLQIESQRIPVSRDATLMYDAHSPLHHALTDGEDFELLFCVAPEKESAFQDAWQLRFELPCTRIGNITDASGCVVCVDASGHVQPLGNEGFTHFRHTTDRGAS